VLVANVTPTNGEIAIAAPYEEQLSRDLEWALVEGSRHFDERSNVSQTLHRIARRLTELQVPYAVAGGMALFAHGLRRFTEDVDIVVDTNGLAKIHRELDGLGYVRLFTQSKNLRDTQSGVRIEFLVTGQYPGDGKPKPVSFPEPSSVAVKINDIRYVNLPTLVELKLASGMTNVGRLKDLADVQELIKLLRLPANFAEQLNPYVRDRFIELQSAAAQNNFGDTDV
jgi:hypothetical protein